PGFRFATEVAPPQLVAVVKPRASKILDTIPEEEMDSIEDQSCSSESIPLCDWLEEDRDWLEEDGGERRILA
ncbi:hypothetical protein, partial [Klebsiella pneumoniae]|uniref:hypothetical protein n=1 Tax=Klebsiella pneumoniae TaxID=573 RepID=UPI001C304DD4